MSRERILFPLLGKYYEAALSERLSSAGYDVTEILDGGHFEEIYTDLCRSSSASTTIIVDVDNESCVQSIIRSVYPAINRPKLVLLTSLLTWCGEISNRNITDPNVDFYSRKPVQCALKAYGLENVLWNMASDPQAANSITYFLGTGLLYGGWGWDFETALRQSWDDSCSSSDGDGQQKFSLPITRGQNTRYNILAIHFENFINAIINLIEDDSCPSPSYHPLVDGIKDPGSTSRSSNCELFHDSAFDSPGNIKATGDVMMETVRDPRKILLSSKVFFSSKFVDYPNRVYRNFPSLFREFTVIHKLAPCNIVLVGGPQCGQTESAQLMAKMLDLQYVDLADSLRWVLDNVAAQVGSESEMGRAVDSEDASRQLVEMVISKLNDGGKKGSFVVSEAALRSFVLTEAFVTTIPLTLQRRCVAKRLKGCPRCRLKGFVVDVWSTGAFALAAVPLIANGEEFLEIIPSSLLPPTDAPADSWTSDLILLEFQSDRNVVLQRLSSKFIEGKATKDQLALLKALETRVDTYSARLIDTVNSYKGGGGGDGERGGKEVEGAEDSNDSPDTYQSHEIVIEFVSLSKCHAATIGLSHQGSIEDVAALVVDEVVPALHGPLGWSPSPVRDSVVDDASVDQSIVTASTAKASYRPPRAASIKPSPIPPPDTGEEDSLVRINEGLSGLKEYEKQALMNNCNELLEYLEINVTPFLARGLIDIERSQPEDPIAFLIDVLECQSAKNRAEAEECAYEEFMQVLRDAEAKKRFGDN